MREYNGIKIGEVYEMSYGETLRIVFLDDISVFACREVLNKKELRKHYVLPRLPLPFFLKNSTKVDYLPLTDEELLTIQPDLPLRFLRSENFDWEKPNFDLFTDKDSFVKAEQIYVTILTKSGRSGEFVLFNSNEGKIFNQAIFESSYTAQKQFARTNDGFGIYRTGFKNYIPTYYVGGYHDAAGHTNYIG